MSLLKDAVVEAIRRMPENVRAKDINHEIRLIDQIIEELKETENIRTITTDEILKRINLKIQEC
jgi:hypothetical protein